MENLSKIEKAVIYARVSSKEQEDTGYSLPAQIKLLQDYAERKNLKIVKIFSVAESASGAKQRKVFSEMMEYLRDNKIPNLLCEKVDRLTRNLKEAVVANDWIESDDSRNVHFVKQNLVIHKNAKSDEKFRWDIEIVLAKKYITNLSEEVKKGQKEKLAQGEFPARAKAGYTTVGEKGHKRHIIDKTTGPLMKRAFELYATGNYSLTSLTKKMQTEGLRGQAGNKIVKSRMHELLSDEFYYGKIRWNNELVQGKHEPLISKDLFDVVQQILSRKLKNPQFKKHFPVFKAKINCDECGGTITWETQKGHWYGHCNHYKKCSQKTWVKQPGVEEQLFPFFDGVAPKNEKVLKILEQALKESHSDEIDYNTSQRTIFTRTIETADKRIERAYKDKLDGQIPEELCKKIMDESKADKEEAIEALKKLGDSRTSYYEAGIALHELALKASDIYKCTEATIEEKRLLLSYAFSNLALNADKIRPNYTLAFEFMSEWMPRINTTFELAERRSIKGKRDAFAPLRPVLLRSLEEVRTLMIKESLPKTEHGKARIALV